MKKRLYNNLKTSQYLQKLPKYYAITLWAKYCVLEVPFSTKCTKDGVPLVWKYYDCNGECDEYQLVPIEWLTSGGILCWSTNKEGMDRLAKKLNGD